MQTNLSPSSAKIQRLRQLLEIERFNRVRDTGREFHEKGVAGLTGQRLAYWNCKTRFQNVAAGRRSGKTILSEWKLERKIWTPKPWKDARYFFAGPTEGQSEQIGWQRMIDLIQQSPNASRIHKINNSDLIITVDIDKRDGQMFRASFHIIGMDRPQRMEGRGWDGGIGDERADWYPGIFGAHIRPALADRKGFFWQCGTPDFEAPSAQEFYEDFMRGLNGQDPNWQSFTWLSAEVVDPEEIEAARRDSSPQIFRQEYEASWESAPGRAYPDFTRTRHANSPVSYDSSLPLIISCDFNRKYHNWGEYQYRDGTYIVLADIFVMNGTTEAMCIETKSRLRKKGIPESGRGVQFYGDYSGEQKRAEATLDSWRQVREAFPEAEFNYVPQPPVTDRLEKVNSIILNAAGESHLVVDPSAANHIADFEKVSRPMAFAGEGGKDGELTHASSAFGYFVHRHQNLIQPNVAPKNPILFY